MKKRYINKYKTTICLTQHGQSVANQTYPVCPVFCKPKRSKQGHPSHISNTRSKMLKSGNHFTISFCRKIGMAAMRMRCAGGWRLWLIARYLDVNKTGWIDYYTLLNFMQTTLGISQPNIKRWIGEACQMGLLSLSCKNNQYRFRIIPERKVAKRLRVWHCQNCRITWKINEFFQLGWRQNLRH